MPSILSKIPPCPGKIVPVSLIMAFLLKNEIIKSPICESIEIMNIKRISYYLGLFCFPISILAFINILYSSYFDYFLSINSYVTTLIVSFVIALGLLFVGRKSEKKINFIEQLFLLILV